MPLTFPRELLDIRNGIWSCRVTRWSDFPTLLDALVMAEAPWSDRAYIWRGQGRADWLLETSLDRLFSALPAPMRSTESLERRSQDHLWEFKMGARGRRQATALKISEMSETDWWALGQHYGLATPLLDWTRSPYAAAYFAFEQPPQSTAPAYRTVFGLDRLAVHARNQALIEGPAIEGRTPIIDFIDPLTDDNPRLVSQGALFTRAPIGTPIERWVAEQFEGSVRPVLLRIDLPEHDRKTCLVRLDAMNINHMSLFPDLSGTSRYANLRMELKR